MGRLILGIDPGTAITGYGLILAERGRLRALDYGAILTLPDDEPAQRLYQIYTGLERIFREFSPDALAIEELFFKKNVTTAMAVGQARGVCLLAAAERSIPISEYTPPQVKLSVTGSGRAEKHQVGYMVRAILGLQEVPRPDDVADALAVAICHQHRQRRQIDDCTSIR